MSSNLTILIARTLIVMKEFITKVFYAPSDWYILHTTQRQRAAINTWLLIVWIVPGMILWFVLRDALWFVGFMSVYAIWTGHLGAASAETPVEAEGDVEINGDNSDVDIHI